MTKKVLFIRPPSSSSLDFGGSIKKDYGGHEIELGMLYIASFLEAQGVEVSFLDMSLYDNSDGRLIDLLKSKRFDFVGLTAYTNFITSANAVAGLVKKHSDAKVVIGGPHASALPIETLERFKNFDYAVYGEGEKAFLDLLSKSSLSEVNGLVWKNGKNIIKNPPQSPIEDLDSLPFPARHLLDLKRYTPPVGNYRTLPSTAILSSRGCPYQCTYCSRTGSRIKNNVRFRSVKSIIKEIRHCINKWGIYDFRFYDDTFVIPKKRLMDFCRALIRNKIMISWNCYSRVDTIDLEMLRLMKKAGCYHIKYGVEFGTNKWLLKTKKNTTLDQARKAIRNTKKVGIAAKASFMIGMPGETLKEIKKTINFAKELNPTYLTFGIFTPLPGSDLFDETKENGTLLTFNYDSYFNKSERLLSSQADLSILNRLIKKAYKTAYFNPKFILHRLVHLARNPSFYEMKSLFSGILILIKK